VALVPTKKDLFCEVDLNGNQDDAKILEDFCLINADSKRIHEAWSHIICSISDRQIPTVLTEKTLSFLVENEIALIDLGHLQLSDEWLQKIYDKDNRCIEALQTIELRK
jgi:hypothetical protein